MTLLHNAYPKFYGTYTIHRHLSNRDCLSFVMCRVLVLVKIGFFSFFAVAVDSTNEANKAGGMHC